MAQIDQDLEEKPLDPQIERVRRKIVRFIGLNLALLMLALMAVGVALVYKWKAEPQGTGIAVSSPGGAPIEANIPLPAGSRIVSQSLSGDRVSIDVEATDGARMLVIYDLASRSVIARLSLTTAAP